MFHVEYLFDLDIADKALKELFEPSGLPYPVLQNAARNALTYTAPRMLTQEEQVEFIKVCCEEFKKTDLGKFVVVRAQYAGIRDAYFIPDEPEAPGQGKQEPAMNGVKVKPHKV
jgi:hypothetical protein